MVSGFLFGGDNGLGPGGWRGEGGMTWIVM